MFETLEIKMPQWYNNAVWESVLLYAFSDAETAAKDN